MTRDPKNSSRSRIAIEDVLVCVLSLAAGPLLWWMSSMWQQLPAASSVQTLEYWIASICGFFGIALCVLWAFYSLSGLCLVLGLKTRNAVLTYWSEVFTPRFLRRVIVSVIGAQVALTSQAFAAPTEDQPTDMESIQHQEPFMPYVHEEPLGHPSPADSTPTESPSATLQPTTAPNHSTPSESAESIAPNPSPTVENRQESQLVVTPEPTVAVSPSDNIDPTPRQTSTIDVAPETVESEHTAAQESEQQPSFMPQQPVPSPYIAAPNQSRIADEPTVVIRAGDCLWDIAVDELGADASLVEIDHRWRKWWDYNRETIGDDPHILSPGTVLVSPPFS